MNASNKLGSGMGIERMKMITSTYPKILTNNWSKKELIEKVLAHQLEKSTLGKPQPDATKPIKNKQ